MSKITVRWNDGFKRDFKPIQHQFGSDYLWMKFADGKEEWIPTRQVRNIKTEKISLNIEKVINY